MNILYHHRTQGTGAEGVHIGHVVKGLRDIGHSVDVVSPNDGDPTKTGGDSPYAKKEGFKARLLDKLSRILPQFMFEILELLYNLSAIKKLEAQIKEKKIDLIYERNAFFLYAGAKMSKKHGIPLVIEVNEVAGEERIRQQFFIKRAKRIEQEVFAQADGIIVVSSFLKDKIAALGVNPDKIHVIPNAADESIFDPALCTQNVREEYNLTDDAIVLGFIGWFVAWHNFELLVDVLSQLAKEQNVYLMLVGDGDLKDSIRSQAESLGCADRLIFTGPVKHHVIPNYVNAMDICIIPGSNAYRSPIKLFEYMIMGKTTVAPSQEPIRFVTEHEINAVHFEPDNAEDFAKAITYAAMSKEDRDRIGDAARERILEKHLWRHNSERVIDIYNGFKK